MSKNIKRDRDGKVYEIDNLRLPPPSSERYANILHNDISDLIEVVNELLNRVYILEQDNKQLKNLNRPKPSEQSNEKLQTR